MMEKNSQTSGYGVRAVIKSLGTLFSFMVIIFAATTLAAEDSRGDALADDSYLDLDRARSALAQGQPAQALELLGPLYERFPQHTEITNNYAVALFDNGQTTEAGLVLQDYLQAHEEVSQPSRNLFKVYDYLAAESYSMLSGNTPAKPRLDVISSQPQVASNAITDPVRLTSSEDAETSSSRGAIEQRLQGYVNAWSAGDIEGYLSYYYPDRSPQRGQTYSSWRDERRAKIFPERDISVSVADLQILPVNDSQAIAVYRQSYRARNYQDETTKQLTWVNTDGQWYIRYEMSLPN